MDRITTVEDASFGFGFPGLKAFMRIFGVRIHGPLWRLNVQYVFVVIGPNGKKWRFLIPIGYLFDKASVPSFFWGFPVNFTPSGIGELAALEHDYLCDILRGGSPWLKAALGVIPVAPPPDVIHHHFETRCLELGVRRSKAKAMGSAVKLFGPKGKLRPSRYL